MFEICSKLAIKTRERRRDYIVNFEHISHIFTPVSSVSIINLEHVIAGWVGIIFSITAH